MIEILVIDDHAVVRNGLRQIFGTTADIAVAAEAHDVASAISCLGSRKIDLILTDLSLPDSHGCELISVLRRRSPRTPVLVFSMHGEVQVAVLALNSGASGYLTKGHDPEMLISAIRRVCSGEKFIDPIIAKQIAIDFISGCSAPRDVAELSARESAIMIMIASGKSGNEIADELCISNKTVSTHKRNLMKKLGLRSTADIAKFAVANKLVSPAM